MLEIKRAFYQKVMFTTALFCLFFSGYMVFFGTGSQISDVTYIGGSTGVMLVALVMLKISQKKKSIGLLKFVD
jgi:hypothetical protein